MVDGVHFAESCCVVALGIDIDGTKHPLAVVEGSTENATLVTELCVGLRERGLDVTKPILAVLDGSKALRRAVLDVFDHPVIGRCQLHKVRNVKDHLPQRMRTGVERRMRAAYHADSALEAEIVGLTEGGEGFDFLGFHHRWVSTRAVHTARQITFLARWPSRKATQHARDRVRDLAARSRLAVPVERVVQDVNLFLRGWAGYFRYGNSARDFDKIMIYADQRMALFVGKRHKRGRRFGQVMLIRSGNRMGLINLNGAVVAPRPNRAWRAPAEHRR